MQAGWRRVTKNKPCPVCGRPDGKRTSTWCIATVDGDVAICPHTPDGAVKFIEDSGYLHRLNGVAGRTRRFDKPFARKNDKPVPRRVVKWLALHEFYRGRAHDDLVEILAGDLDVDPSSLHMLGLGYEGNNTWTFPMHDDTGKIIGIRKRNYEGKTAVFGSRNGLFLPGDYQLDRGSTIIICEGPTDCAKAIDLGYPSIGRACCNAGEAMIERYIAPRAIHCKIVIMADNDKDRDDIGLHYANKLAKRIKAKVILPARGKDLREWNPTKEEFAKVIAEAQSHA